MQSADFDIVRIAGVSTLYLDSQNIEASLEYYREHQIDLLGINPMRGFLGRDLAFLREFPFVKGLEIVSPLSGGFDLDPIRALKGLRSLTVSDKVSLDLREFPELEELRVVWDKGLRLEGSSSLRLLHLRQYRPKSGDLAELPMLPKLEALDLVQAPLKSLDGVERFPALRHLELAYTRTLRTLSALRTTKLESLFFKACPKIGDYAALADVKGLRNLRINGCARIPSLKFLDQLPVLKEFRFVGTSVEDGDLTPILRLHSVGFDAKRHYSHSPKEVEAILAKNAVSRPS